MSLDVEYSRAFIEETVKKCTHFFGPLRIPKRIPPNNYESILKILQTYSSFDLNSNWIQLITDQFNKEDIQFQNDQLMTTYVANYKTRWMFFSMFFTILTMIFIYFFFSMSKEFTERVSKFIRFRKYYTGYTIIPVFCCILIISLTISFGKEAHKAGTAIENAAGWKTIALNRNEHVRIQTWKEINCSTVLPFMNEEQTIDLEYELFNIVSADINDAISRYMGQSVDYKLTTLFVFAKLKLFKIHHGYIFDETDLLINRTYDLLKIPRQALINTAKYSIFIVSTVSICFTSFICLMVFLDLKNKYPIIVELIQLFSPILLLFIIIGYFFIWFIFTSIVGSYTVYTHLAHPEIHENIEFKRPETVFFFESLASNQVFKILPPAYETWSKTNVTFFDVYPRKIIEELMEKTDKTSQYDMELYYGFLWYCNANQSYYCTWNSQHLQSLSEEYFDFQALKLHDFGVPAISYLRYLSFFKQNTFVPIASLVWNILPLPALIFFNLIFIHFATPLIRKNSEESSSDGFM